MNKKKLFFFSRSAVINYVNHLQKLEDKNSVLLIAYIYHLYMGLLSGGQILRKKRQLMQKILPYKSDNLDGNRVVNFGDHSIYQLKTKIKKIMNEIAESLDDNTKELLIAESKTVFAMNNMIIKSVEGAGMAIIKKIVIFTIICLILYLFYSYI